MERLRQLIHATEYRRQWKKYPMTISDAHRYVWFRVARCGTRTIKSLLEELENSVLPRAAPFARFDAAAYGDYFKFAFVRNRYDRLISSYFRKVHGSNENRLRLRHWRPRLSFPDFVDCVRRTPDSESNRHYRSQHTLLDLESLNFLGRLENFENDIMVVMERLMGQRATKVPWLNKTKRSHYSHYYDDDSRTLAGERFAEDLRLLGYDFEDRPEEASDPSS